MAAELIFWTGLIIGNIVPTVILLRALFTLPSLSLAVEGEEVATVLDRSRIKSSSNENSSSMSESTISEMVSLSSDEVKESQDETKNKLDNLRFNCLNMLGEDADMMNPLVNELFSSPEFANVISSKNKNVKDIFNVVFNVTKNNFSSDEQSYIKNTLGIKT